MKRNRFSLTLRIFLSTCALMIAACALTYGAIAYLTPISYTAILEDEMSSRRDVLVEALLQVQPDEAEPLLAAFGRETGAEIRLVHDNGEVLYDTMPQHEAATDIGAETMVDYDTVREDVTPLPTQEIGPFDAAGNNAPVTAGLDMGTAVVEADSSSDMAYVAFADGTGAWLTTQGGQRAVNQAVEALGRILPFLIVIVLAISLAGSAFYAWLITRPIVSINKIARRMAKLDFDVRWEKPRSDEIGELGESLNLLSANLSTALRQLEEANRQLKSDIDRERELERQRLAFFSAASHELKTPITILKGQLSGMLAQVGIYQDREKYLARALEVTGRMESLVREILTINRIGTGDFSVRREAVDLSGLMAEQIRLDADLAEQKGLTIQTDIAPGVTVQGDRALLAKVLDNVLMNAMLYSPPGASLTVTVMDAGFTVENSGAEIPEASLPQLFTAFYRVEQSRNRKSGGSGLGLYLVKSILDLHGATCEIRNSQYGVLFMAAFPTE